MLQRLKNWFGQDTTISEQDEQTALPGLALVRKEFGQHPARGLTPTRLAQIMDSAEQRNLTDLMDLAEDMEERDAHLYAEISKRKRALLSLEWTIDPPRSASAAETGAAEQVKEQILGIPDLEDVFLDLGDAILKGFSCLEIAWRRIGSIWLPGSLTLRPQRWFTLDESRLNLTLRNNHDPYGEPLWPLGWITHIHRAKSGYIARSGLVRILAWPYLFKNYSVRDLAEFLEIAGGIRLGKYPVGTPDKDKDRLLSALVSIGHNTAGIIPDSMSIELHDASKASADPYMKMVDWAERSESKAILGQTLSAEASSTGLGSGVAALQADVREDILKSDARQIASTITRDLVYPLLALNAGWQDPLRCPRFRFVIEEIEPVLQAPSPAKAKQPPRVAVGKAGAGTDIIDDWTDAATRDDWEQQLGPVIDPVQAAAAAASDYDDFLLRLDLLSTQIDPRLIVQKLADNMFRARGMGDATDSVEPMRG